MYVCKYADAFLSYVCTYVLGYIVVYVHCICLYVPPYDVVHTVGQTYIRMYVCMYVLYERKFCGRAQT